MSVRASFGKARGTGALALGLLLAASAALAGQACGGTPDSTFNRRTAPSQGEGADPTEAFTGEAMREYMRQLAPYLVSRELEAAELAALDEQKFDAIAPMLEAWTKEPAFPRAARRLISQKLSVSGSRDGIDFDLPGNLAEHVARENLPLSTLLTADYCIDANGAKRECDTGAPFTAGVLGTRAFLVSRASRFNLTRASTMLHVFACQGYPMSESLEPRIERSRLIPMFQVDRQADDAGAPPDEFGNGTACYACHAQFGWHAQLFVRFDTSGLYRQDATGIQDPNGELGRSVDGLFASHLADPAEAKEDTSQMLGQAVKDLGEAAKVLAESPTFVPCQVKNLLEYALRLPPTAAIADEVLEEISAKAKTGEPLVVTFGSLAVATFSHPRVVSAVVNATSGAEPSSDAGQSQSEGEP